MRILLVAASFALCGLAPAAAQTTTFSNPALIDVPEGPGAATPYPSSLVVDGLDGTVVQVRVILRQFQHRNPDDVGVLLVGPGGQRIRLMSDSGAIDPFDLGELDPAPISRIVFATSATNAVPDTSSVAAGGIPSGTYRPSLGTSGPGANSGPHAENWPAPAPAAPYSLDMSSLLGPAAAMQGRWDLYVDDDTAGGYGRLIDGWEMEIETTPLPEAPSVALDDEVVLLAGGGNVDVDVIGIGVAPGSLALNCAIAAGTANFRIGGGGQRDIAAPATLGAHAPPIALACDPGSAQVNGMMICAQSGIGAGDRADIEVRVVCPAAPPPPLAPTVAALENATLTGGVGQVALSVASSGVAPAQLGLACSIAPSGANFRIEGDPQRVAIAPATLGASLSAVALRCDPQPIVRTATLSCTQNAIPSQTRGPLSATITCPRAAVVAPAVVPVIPATAPMTLALLLTMLLAVGLIALRHSRD